MKAIALKNATKGTWTKIGVEGVWEGHMMGRFDLSVEDFEQMLENFEKLNLDVVVDYEHQTLYGEKAPAAGWIKHPIGLKVEEGELYVKIKWNESAKDHIKEKEYKYLSPVFTKDTTDPESGANIGWSLHSVAVTNKPFLSEIDSIANKSNTEDNMSKELKDQVEKLEKTNKGLSDEITTLKEQNQKFQDDAATSEVDSAIANKKIGEDQKEWALKYAKDDNEGFKNFLSTCKEKKQKPEDNQFANKNNQNQNTTDDVSMSKV